jgi:hypothetical protein
VQLAVVLEVRRKGKKGRKAAPKVAQDQGVEVEADQLADPAPEGVAEAVVEVVVEVAVKLNWARRKNLRVL